MAQHRLVWNTFIVFGTTSLAIYLQFIIIRRHGKRLLTY